MFSFVAPLDFCHFYNLQTYLEDTVKSVCRYTICFEPCSQMGIDVGDML